MQQFFNSSRNIPKLLKPRFQKYSTDSLSGKKPIQETLSDIQKYFNVDSKTKSKLNSLQKIIPSTTSIDSNFKTFEPLTVSLGICQSNDIKTGLFVDSLITDPFSDNNEYAKAIKSFREKNPKSNIKIIYGTANSPIGNGIFQCKSPILNSDLRLIQDVKTGDGSSKLLNREIFNNLSFIEVNDKTFSKNVEIDGATSLDFDRPKDDKIQESDIQLWVYVKSPSDATEKVNDLPYFVVVNNKSNNGPGSLLKENSNDFEVDLEKLDIANTLLLEDVGNVSKYLNLYQESNINALLFTLNKETSGYKPTILVLRSLLKDLKIEESNDVELAKILNKEIKEWSQNAHFELQSKVTPFVEKILLKELTKINQLIVNSGDLTLLIATLLNDSRIKIKTGVFNKEVECYGSLQESTGKTHYLEGKIDGLFGGKQQQNEKVEDFLINLKKELATKKLPELQSNINKFLTTEIIGKPFIVFLICNFGYIYDFISLNTTVAITALSIALAINTSQKKIIKIIDEFKDWYLEQLRLYINHTARFLSNRLDNTIDNYEFELQRKRDCIEEVRSFIKELEEADKKMKE